uniref:Neprosin PEP catalytic domain-containing protein n=1 Tax=Quercus lobata TaxID=97700 RepID=A0A7N2LSK7_QUELO
MLSKKLSPGHRYAKIKLDEACPKGTVPVLRVADKDQLKNVSNLNKSRFFPNDQWNHGLEFAGIFAGIFAKTTPDKKYKGVSGVMTVWNPENVGPNQYSSVAISAEVGEGPDYTRIQFGWTVFPFQFQDSFTHWFFQVTDPEKESPWWLFYNEEPTPIGYFSNKLFTKLSDGVDTLKWGGYVFTQPGDETSPQMGSGKFDNGIYQRTTNMINVRYIDNNYQLVDSPNDIQTVESRCYLEGDQSYKDDKVGYTFFFWRKRWHRGEM